jgi:hypothetical protein
LLSGLPLPVTSRLLPLPLARRCHSFYAPLSGAFMPLL